MQKLKKYFCYLFSVLLQVSINCYLAKCSELNSFSSKIYFLTECQLSNPVKRVVLPYVNVKSVYLVKLRKIRLSDRTLKNVSAKI